MWALALFGPETMGRYGSIDHATVKILKVVVFCLMMTHVVTNRRDLDKIPVDILPGTMPDKPIKTVQ